MDILTVVTEWWTSWWTTLWWTEVLSRSRCSWSSTTSLLDAQSSAFVHLALESILRCISALGCLHLDEAETTTLASVWITHDVALLDWSVFLKQSSHLFLAQTWVNSSNEKVGACVGIAFIVAILVSAVAVAIDCQNSHLGEAENIPFRAVICWLIPNASIAIAIWAW